jgi:hypothetical protein
MISSIFELPQMPRPVETPKYRCQYCHDLFVRENRYLAHECKQMKRDKELKTPLGQTAWRYYQLWLREQKRMAPQEASTFTTSKYYRTFLNFAQFVSASNLPWPEKFIWLMVSKKWPPTLWTTDSVYTTYIEFLDYKTTPQEQIKLSIETVISAANKYDIDITEVFAQLHPNEIIQHIRTRRLSPWFLLYCQTFKTFFKERISPEQKIIIETLIRPEHWVVRMKEEPDVVTWVKTVVKDLNI